MKKILLIIALFVVGLQVHAATILETNSSDTLNTFRTNVNTSLNNLNAGLGSSFPSNSTSTLINFFGGWLSSASSTNTGSTTLFTTLMTNATATNLHVSGSCTGCGASTFSFPFTRQAGNEQATSTVLGTYGGLLGLSSTTLIGTITAPDFTSALLQTGAGGAVAEYGGTSCTNQFVRSLSALGIATCATVASTDVDSSIALSATTLTIAGTANQITSSAGAQSLAANRTWTLSLPSDVILPGTLLATGSTTLQSFTATNSTTTNATTTNFNIDDPFGYPLFHANSGRLNVHGATSTFSAQAQIVAPDALLHITHAVHNEFDPVQDLSSSTQYALLLQNLVASNSSSTGIGFTVTNVDHNVGGAIVFNRLGGNSQGNLQFYTKQSTAAGADPVLAMTIDRFGDVVFHDNLRANNSTGPKMVNAIFGSPATPTFTFEAVEDTGMYLAGIATDLLGFAAGGTSSLLLGAASSTLMGDLTIGGDATTTTLAITGVNTQSGVGNALCVTTGGVLIQDDSPSTACSGASSRTVKNSITPLEKSLDFILSLNPVSYVYNKDYTTDQTTHLGFIAEEVGDERLQDKGKVLGLKYVEFVAPIVGAIQELWDKVASHNTRIEELEKRVAELEAVVMKLKK